MRNGLFYSLRDKYELWGQLNKMNTLFKLFSLMKDMVQQLAEQGND